MDRPLLDIKNVTKTYGKSRQTVTALRDVNLTVPAQPARIVTIAGESGSGKTTLANAVLGFVTLTSGQILFEGQDVAHLHGQGAGRLSGPVRRLQPFLPRPACLRRGHQALQTGAFQRRGPRPGRVRAEQGGVTGRGGAGQS